MQALLVKLGGSLITEKRLAETVRADVLQRLSRELARARSRISERLVIGHGSGSFGHRVAAEFDLQRGVRSPEQIPGITATQKRAATLHRQVLDALVAAGLSPFSLAPSSSMVAAAGRPVSMAPEPLLLALTSGLVPVTYGDVVLDRRWGACICSTETVFRYLIRRLRRRRIEVRRILWLGETDGVYDDQGRTIPRVTPAGLRRTLGYLGSPAGTDVTGGMRHRLETAAALARLGVSSWILNGLVPGLLERAMLGEEVPGTQVPGLESSIVGD